MTYNLRALVLFLSLFYGAIATAEVKQLSVQDVVDQILKSGKDKKNIDYAYQRLELPLDTALSNFDWGLTSTVGWEINRLESLTGFNNVEDRNLVWKLGLSKKFSTGTKFDLEYSRTMVNSILSTFANSIGRLPNTVQDQAGITIRQNLLGNFFGLSDRAKLTVAERNFSKASMDREESLEDLILKSVNTYWMAFKAKETLKRSLDAREKYTVLVKTLERKNRQGLSERAEYTKAKAELANKERDVKSASVDYLNLLDQLFLLLSLPPSEDVVFVLPKNLPEAPVVREDKKLETLRKVRGAAINVENAKEEKEAARKETWPTLDLVGQSTVNGVEPTADAANSDMSSGEHYRSFVGLEFNMKFDSNLAQGTYANKSVLYNEALNNFEKIKDEELDRMERTLRDVKAKFLVAKAAMEASEHWERAIKEQERNFRVGRISTAELIQDYNTYYATVSLKSAAVSDYYYVLQEYMAARDQLVKVGSAK